MIFLTITVFVLVPYCQLESVKHLKANVFPNRTGHHARHVGMEHRVWSRDHNQPVDVEVLPLRAQLLHGNLLRLIKW